MARKLKCYGFCGNQYLKEELTKFSLTGKGDGANYCPECLVKKKKEFEDRNELYDFIKKTYSIPFPTGLMLKHIKQYTEMNGYTLKNIRFTLDYVFNIKKTHKPASHLGLWVVPYNHDDMIKYYKNLKEKRESTNIKDQKIVQVTLKMPSLENTYRKKKLIDMDNLI